MICVIEMDLNFSIFIIGGGILWYWVWLLKLIVGDFVILNLEVLKYKVVIYGVGSFVVFEIVGVFCFVGLDCFMVWSRLVLCWLVIVFFVDLCF